MAFAIDGQHLARLRIRKDADIAALLKDQFVFIILVDLRSFLVQ